MLPSAALGGVAAYGEFVDPEVKKLMEENVYSPFQEYVYKPVMDMIAGSGKPAEEEQKPLVKVIPAKVHKSCTCHYLNPDLYLKLSKTQFIKPVVFQLILDIGFIG